MKIVDGGWVPLLLAGCAMVVMWTWVRGAALLAKKTRRDSISMQDLIRMLEKSKPIRVAGTAVFLTNTPEVAPSAFMHNLKHNKVMHERVWLMSVVTEDTPRVPISRRFEIQSCPRISPASFCTTAIWRARAFRRRSRPCARPPA